MRNKRVGVEDRFSQRWETSSEVPQGSVLISMLLNIFINFMEKEKHEIPEVC